MFTLQETTFDLRERLGLQDDSEGEVVIFRKDPRRKFGQGEYITKIAARDFTGYDVIARFGPGDYIVRYMLNGRYQPGGYAEVSISREAAIEAGWSPEEDKKDNSQQQQPGTTVQQYIPDAIWNEIQAMREDLRVERQTKDAWLQAIIEKLGEKKDDSMNSMIATLLAVMQSSNEQFKLMMAEMDKRHQEAQQQLAQVLSQMQQSNAHMFGALITAITQAQQNKSDIKDFVAAIAPFIRQNDPERLATSFVQMFQSGVQAATNLGSPSQPEGLAGILQSIAPAVAPLLIQQLLSRKEAAPSPPPAASPPQPAQPPQEQPQERKELPRETSASPAASSPQAPEQHQALPRGMRPLPPDWPVRLANGDRSVVKQIFINNLLSAMSMTSDRDAIYEYLTLTLPRAVHEAIPEIPDPGFTLDDGVDPSYATYVWKRIAAEYEEEEDEAVAPDMVVS